DGAGSAELPHDVTFDPKTGKFVHVEKTDFAPPTPAPAPTWLRTAQLDPGGGVSPQVAPVPQSRPIALMGIEPQRSVQPSSGPSGGDGIHYATSTPQPQTGTAQGGRYHYVRQADGTVLNTDTGHVYPSQ